MDNKTLIFSVNWRIKSNDCDDLSPCAKMEKTLKIIYQLNNTQKFILFHFERYGIEIHARIK